MEWYREDVKTLFFSSNNSLLTQQTSIFDQNNYFFTKTSVQSKSKFPNCFSTIDDSNGIPISKISKKDFKKRCSVDIKFNFSPLFSICSNFLVFTKLRGLSTPLSTRSRDKRFKNLSSSRSRFSRIGEKFYRVPNETRLE